MRYFLNMIMKFGVLNGRNISRKSGLVYYLAIIIYILQSSDLNDLTCELTYIKRIFLARHRLVPFHIKDYEFRAVCYLPAKHLCCSLQQLLLSFYHYTFE